MRKGDSTWFGARRLVERGAMLPALAAMAVVVLITTALIVGLAERVINRSQAQAAADAASLAGAMEGRAGAQRLAVANGGAMIEFEADGNWVRVVVEVDGWSAEARAERSLSFEP